MAHFFMIRITNQSIKEWMVVWIFTDLGIVVSAVVYVVLYYALSAVGINSGYTRALEGESERFSVPIQPSMTKDM